MKPLDIKIQNYYTQTGVGSNLKFMWKYGAGNHKQTAYKIDIFKNDALIFSTGKILSKEQNNIELSIKLSEQTEYEFTVCVWDENDVPEISDKAKFITGIKEFKSLWIGNGTKKPFIARKRFTASGSNDKAILSLCVAGQFEVRVNNKKISPYAYEGSQTDFNKHIHYSTYDISNFILQGENEITVEVANGWYIGDDDNGKRYFYTIDKGYKAFGDCLVLTAQLKIADNYILTDNTWQISKSKTTLANIYGSEDIDNTIKYEWKNAKVLTENAPKGIIIPFDYPPVIRKRCYEPKSVNKDLMVFDFGQNMSSQFYLKIKGSTGQKVKIIPAEKLSSAGNIEQTADTYSVLTLSGKEDVFEQKFSLNGARWYKIEGASYRQIIEFKSYFVTSSAEDCGYFHCSDERLNDIYKLVLAAIESNLNHSHTDCPTIEKLGWLEINNLMAKSIMFTKDVDTLWSKIAMDMRDSQYDEGDIDFVNGKYFYERTPGMIPAVAPRYCKFVTCFWNIIAWGSSIILAPYEQYKFYKNKQVLEDSYDSAKKYTDYLTKEYNAYNDLYGKDGEERFICSGLGDWGIKQNVGANRENIETAFYYHDLTVMSEIADILGKDDKLFFKSQAEKVKQLYNKSLLKTENGKAYYRSCDDGSVTQSNQAIPICFGLVPDEYKDNVSDTLVSLCENHHLRCGEVGLVYILRALSQAGRNDIILDMITKDTHPSYLRFINNGETALPEFWRDDARSRNHDMMGHIIEWFFTDVAGLTSDDGFKTISVSPKCRDFIDSFECVYKSIRGDIEISFSNGKLTTKIPCNVCVKNSGNEIYE